MVFKENHFLALLLGKFDGGANVFRFGGADEKAVCVFDEEFGEGRGLAVALFEVWSQAEHFDVDGMLLVECACGMLRATLSGLVNGIALIAANDPDSIFAEDFTVLAVRS